MTENDSKSIAYSYIRLSSKQQIVGDGQRRQLEAATEYCRQHNLKLSSKSFRDLGVSAFKEVDRPSLSDLHECIERGIIRAGDVIILEKLDRLSRQGISKTQQMLQDILSKGVIVVSLMDGLRLDKHSLNDLTLVIRIAIAADLANKESAAKSVRVQANKDAAREKVREGKPIDRRLPFWLSYADGKYRFSDKKPLIDRIIEQRLNGVAYNKITTQLNAEGIAPPNGGKKWNASTLRTVCRNPILYGAHQVTTKIDGIYQPLEIVNDYYPAVISYSTFKDLNGLTIVRPAGQSETNSLSGLVYCGTCGFKMTTKSRINKKDGQKVIYHHCKQYTTRACTNNTYIRDLQGMVLKNITHLTMKTVDKSVNVDALRDELISIESRITELTNELSNVGSVLPVAAIIASVKKLEEQRTALNMTISQSVEINQTSLESILDNIDDPKRFNMDLKKVIRRIEVTPVDDYHRVLIERHDGHFIRWRTGQIVNTLTDTEKMGNMLKGMLEGVEEE